MSVSAIIVPNNVKVAEPRFYPIADTRILPGLERFLDDIGNSDWKTDAPTDGEKLIEVTGRLCYRSWGPWNPANPWGSNPNVTRTREGNRLYIGNIIQVGHGSVFEHPIVSVILHEISRVLSHEFVRHRPGWAYSQESGRFVRDVAVRLWVPDSVRAMGPAAVQQFLDALSEIRKINEQIYNMLGIDDDTNFNIKKAKTSTARRLAPFGHASTIVCTGNLRAWRHVLTMRTAPNAEEEMIHVMVPLGEWFKQNYPNAFQDMERDGDSWQFSVAPKL